MGKNPLDVIFGGSSSTGLYSDSQDMLADKVTDRVRHEFGRGVTPYGGQITADTTGNQQAAFDRAQGNYQDPFQFSRYMPALQSAVSGDAAISIDPAQREQYFNDAFVEPAKRDFGDFMQNVDHRYGARFGKAGSQLEAGHRGAERFATTLGQQRAGLLRGDEMDMRKSEEAAANRAAQTASGLYAPLSENQRRNTMLQAGLGAEERGIEGQHRGEAFNKWSYGQAYNNPWLGMMGTALAPEPQKVESSSGIFGGLMGLAGGLIG